MLFSPFGILARIIDFYAGLIVVYVLLSWFPVEGAIAEIRRVIGTLVEPYLGLFRRIIPPIGMIDISPAVAIFVLYAIVNLLGSLF